MDVSFDDDEEGVDSGGSNVMMSLFASYYGIDPGNSVHNKTAAELIDTAHFNSEEYVRDLLEKAPLEKLVETNTEMTNEIKSLDSDMQMLVYENYSKFISATETIKRMKTNVEAMDEDVEIVKNNMLKISTISSDLDSCFKDNRTKLAKLVRVRRLLKRLEFLTELPERIADMIESEKYGAAVKLYSKTINILKEHSHVLSFKNIQERTEKMMSELRNKVMLLLDDNSIDSIKLTQHVSVLRLMEVPRQQVVEKFLNAHKIRAENLLLSYERGTIPFGVEVDANVTRSLKKVTDTRKFHQLLISNLTEACKGLTELFCPPNSSNTVVATPAKGESSSFSSTSVSRSGSADSADGSNKSSSYTNREEIRRDATITRKKLDDTIAKIMPEYTKRVVSSLQTFFNQYDDQMQAYIDLESKVESEEEESEENGVKLQKAQLELYDLEEEKQGWVMLLRQAILDCQYLDASMSECCSTGASSDGETIVNTEKFGVFFGMNAIEALCTHINTSFDRRGLAFVNKMFIMIPQIFSVSVAGTGLRGSISSSPLNSTNNLNSSEGITLQSQVPAKLSEIKSRMSKNASKIELKVDRLVEFCLSTFSDICADSRPYLDIISVSDIKVLKLEEVSMKILWKYIDFLCKSFDFACNVDISLLDAKEDGSSYLSLSEFVLDIYSQKSEGNVKYVELNDIGSSSSEGSTKDTYALIILSFLKRLNTTKTFNRFEGIMKSHDLVIPSPESYSNYEARYINRLDMTIRQVLMKFIDFNCNYFSSIVYENIQDSIKNFLLPRISMIKDYDDITVDIDSPEANELLSIQKSLTVSKYVVDIAVALDSMLSSCSVLLNESLPPLKASSAERDLSRRGRARQGAMAQGRSGADVHLNIERLFAQKICVFDREAIMKVAVGSTTSSSISTIFSNVSGQQNQTPPCLVTITDVVLNSLIKCVLKYIQEYVRLAILPHGAYIQLQADISFIKQVACLVLRETGEVDGIVELIYTSLFTRYIHANDIGLAGDSSNDITAILRATSEGLAIASRRSLLLPK